jgi:cholesterol transport system auxiliary component
VERYLRVEAVGGQCAKSIPESRSEAQGVVAVMDFTALDNLDRPAVLVASGNVLVPSTRWYWEGAPQDVMTGVVVRTVNCLPGVAGVLKYRPRVEHQAVLTGSVTAFNVQRKGGPRFVAAARLEVWTKDAKKLVASREFAAEAPLTGETPEAIADAASAAASQVADQAAAWLSGDSGGVLAKTFAEAAR